ncbi:MAG TPA: PaaI family thioesterase [Polyangia bacterium]|jgi:Thioesterase superfamily.|nr:PaaI family thioesterase [Polyangia bacterium]
MNDFSPERTPDAAAVWLAQQKLDAMKIVEHSRCLLCGKDNPIGFKLDFRVVRPGMVLATFPCSRVFQSYPETLHGGVISALFDAAMTNCLFSLGEVAVTAELVVHYLRPTRVDQQAEVVAELRKSSWPMYQMTAELRQAGITLARAEAKFVNRRYAADAQD